jgi:hypothetical protein
MPASHSILENQSLAFYALLVTLPAPSQLNTLVQLRKIERCSPHRSQNAHTPGQAFMLPGRDWQRVYTSISLYYLGQRFCWLRKEGQEIPYTM